MKAQAAFRDKFPTQLGHSIKKLRVEEVHLCWSDVLVRRPWRLQLGRMGAQESYTFRSGPERPLRGNRPNAVKPKLTGPAGEIFQGKFTWKIEHFKRDLKENLKKKKITVGAFSHGLLPLCVVP